MFSKWSKQKECAGTFDGLPKATLKKSHLPVSFYANVG